MRKTAPRSKQKGKPNAKADETTSSSNSNEENYAFQSPDKDNETDYGLEFTTSRLSQLNTSPRRCSTLRKKSPTKQQRDPSTSEDDDEDQENRTPDGSSSSNVRAQQKSTVINQQKKKPINVSAPTVRKPLARRKQSTPQQRLALEIARLQSHSGFLIPRLPFARMVREIMINNSNQVSMITSGAMEAIQTATEMYLTQRFQDAYLLTRYRGRVTLEVRDMAMVAYFCKTYGNL